MTTTQATAAHQRSIPVDEPVASTALGYRAHLDGLRAVAVYLVVAYHSGVDRLAGGFIGVDVFFVLSGYLVTQLLLRDLDSMGSIRFARFYSRRVRRLLPAAVVALAGTAVVFGSIGSPAEWADARAGIRAAALYFANWHFIHQASDYFANDITANPVLHFWSLAVEEQFYLLWPLMLVAGYRVTRRTKNPRRSLQILVAAIVTVSGLAALSLAGSNLNRAYYGTDTRAYQLLSGALLALIPGIVVRLRRHQRLEPWLGVVSVAALGSLVLAASSVVDVDPIKRGVVTTVLCLVLIGTLDGTLRGPVRWALSLPPVVYLGRISYGTYLWHWIIILVLDREVGDLGSRSTFLIAMVSATAVASLSYELLEHPIRTWNLLDRYRRPTIAVGVAMSLTVGLVFAPFALERTPTRVSVGDSEVSAGRAVLDWQAARQDLTRTPACTPDDLDACVLHKGSGPTIMLVGDSQAAMLAPMIEEASRKLDLEFVAATRPQCAWFIRAASAIAGEPCQKAKDAWYGPVLEAFDPEVVVLVHQLYDEHRAPNLIAFDDGWISTDDDDLDQAIRDQTSETVDFLRDGGHKVVIVEPIPQPVNTQPPIDCIARGDDLNACRFTYPTGPTNEEQFDRSLDVADDQVWSLDLDRAVCPYLPICDPVVNGGIVMADQIHLTSRFARTLGPTFEKFLLDSGIVSAS